MRPTTDFAKEGLFNILQHRFRIDENDILDLFSGTGNMSLEFASRGANSVISVDQNRKCIQYIEQISRQLEINNIDYYTSEAEKFLQKCPQKFDLIFADPPYAYQRGIKIWNTICERGLLKEGGFFILEHGKDQEFNSDNGFMLSRKFGNVNFTFFQQES